MAQLETQNCPYMPLAISGKSATIPPSGYWTQIKPNGAMQMAEEEIGRISDFYAHPVVAGIGLTASLKVGDKIRIKGHTTDVEMTVDSMQIDNADVQEANAGDSIGVKVPERVRKHDTVYKIVE